VAVGPGDRRGQSPPVEAVPGTPAEVAVVVRPAAGVVLGHARFPDGRPAAGARVFAGSRSPESWALWFDRNQSWRDPGAIPVAADGSFRIEGVPAGEVSLSAGGPGFVRAEGPSFPLAAGETKDGIEIEMTPPCSVAGRVLDPQGSPVPGAGVVVEPWKEGQEEPPPQYESWQNGSHGDPIPAVERAMATTDAGGRFRLEGIAPGDLWVTAGSRDHLDSWARARAGDEGAEVRLRAPLAIAGRVVDADTGKPVPGISVTCWPEDYEDRLSRRGEEARTGEDGAFRLGGLAPGKFRISCRDPDPRSARQDGGAEGVSAGTRDLEVRLAPGLSLGGRVVDETGAPVEDLSVALDGESDEGGQGWIWGRRTGKDGTFRYSGLKPGPYGIRVGTNQPPPFRGAADAEVVGQDFPHLAAGREDLVLRVQRGLHIRGRVVDADGRPGQPAPGGDGACVRLFPSGEAGEARERGMGIAWVREDGTFESGPLRPGSRHDLFAVGFRQGPVGILREVAAGAPDAVLRLERGRALGGRVVDLQGEPAPEGIFVNAKAVDPPEGAFGASGAARTRADGSFLVEGLGDFEFELTVDLFGQEFLPVKEKPRARAGTTDLVLAAPRGAVLSGRVVDAQGRGVKWAGVGIKGRDRGFDLREGGRFEFRGLPPGEYALLLDGPGGKEIEAGTFTAPAEGIVLVLPRE